MKQLLKHSLFLECVVSSPRQECKFNYNLLDKKLNEIEFLKLYDKYCQDNQISMDYVLVDNKNIEQYVYKLKFTEQEIRKILEYMHTYINLTYPECIDIEQLYSEFDSDGIGFLNEDQIFFLFLVLIMKEQFIDQINLLLIFEQFYQSIQQKGKLTLRAFKRFFLQQDYKVQSVIQDLQKLKNMLKIIKIPDIRNDLLSEMQGNVDQNLLLMKLTYNSLLNSKLNNHIIELYKQKIHYFLDLFLGQINPKQNQQNLQQIELNQQERNDFVYKNYQNAIQKLINMNKEQQKIIFSDSVKVINVDLSNKASPIKKKRRNWK